MHPPTDAPPISVESWYGYLFGLFPVNALHNVVHLAIGVAGMSASATMSAAIIFCRTLAVFYGALAVMGLVPGLNTLFGLVPLFGHDVWLHGLTAVTAAYFGWPATETRATEPAPHPIA